jgi:uroporphyrin-III C-methyltransferase
VTGYWAELPLAGRRVLIVGGGPAALPRIAAVSAARAEVTVIAPQALAAIADLADRGLIRWLPRELEPADLAGSWLVFAAAGLPEIDTRTTELANQRGVFCLPGSELRDPTTPSGRRSGGRVILVGGGPGDPGLVTVSGVVAIREADVIISDRLAPLAALSEAPKGAELIDVSKIPHGRTTQQEEINRLLIEHAQAGRTVVRLKGGDSFVFGRGGEELEACIAAGVEVQLVPGVTSAVAGPELAGIPVTHRGLNQGFSVISGHVPPGHPQSTLDYAALARTGTDLVLMMAVATLPAIAQALLDAGMPPETPAATVADAGLASQREVRGTVATIAALNEQARIRSPAVTVIGAVAGFDARR